jgi:hypothetical protein
VQGSHWPRVDKIVSNAAAGHSVKLAIEPSKKWPESDVPENLKSALAAGFVPQVH